MNRIICALLLIFLLPFAGFKNSTVESGGEHHGNSFDIEALASSPSSRDIITGMLSAVGNTRTLQYTFKSYERLAGSKEFFTEMDVKATLSPIKVYAYTKSDPNKGVEVLYIDDKWEGKAMVNPGKWLPTLKLSPSGGRMRENQHHTLLDVGFNLLAGIIKDAVKRADAERPGEFDTFCRNEGDVTWNGKQCYKIVIDDPTFTYLDYTVKEGDNVDNIALRKFICGYLIIEKNPTVKNWDSLKPGMTIKIPSSYAKKTILYIDKENNLPIVQIMHDEAGQFEKYEFHNLRVNPAFKANEFDPEFEGYNF